MGKVVSSIFGGGDAGVDEMKKANRLTRSQLERLDALKVPGLTEQEIALALPELAGLLEAEALGSSRFEEISMDPRLQAAQMAAGSCLFVPALSPGHRLPPGRAADFAAG